MNKHSISIKNQTLFNNSIKIDICFYIDKDNRYNLNKVSNRLRYILANCFKKSLDDLTLEGDSIDSGYYELYIIEKKSSVTNINGHDELWRANELSFNAIKELYDEFYIYYYYDSFIIEKCQNTKEYI